METGSHHQFLSAGCRAGRRCVDYRGHGASTQVTQTASTRTHWRNCGATLSSLNESPHLPLEMDVTEPRSDWFGARWRNLWTMNCVLWLQGISRPEMDHFNLLDRWAKISARFSMLSVGPTVTTGLSKSNSHTSCRNSNITLVVSFSDCVCLT